MQCISLIVMVVGAQALQQSALSVSADPGFKLASEESREVAASDETEMEAFDESERSEFGMKAEELMTRMAVVSELVPSDFKDKSSRYWNSEAPANKLKQVLYITSVIGFCTMVGLIYAGRGWVAMAAIIGYVLSLCFMALSIRNVFVSHNFNYPQWMVVCHSVCTVTVGFTIMKTRENMGRKKIEYPSLSTWWKALIPLAVTFALSLGLSNLGLLYSNAHFYEMMGAFNLHVIIGLQLLLGKHVDIKYTAPVAAVTVGLVSVTFGEMKFSLLGLMFIIAGTLCRATRQQLQSIMMSPNQMTQHFDPVELVTYTGFVTFFVMLVWSAAAEGMQPWRDIMDLGTIGAVFLTCIFATLLNFCGMIAMKELGPVAREMVSQLKGVMVVTGGWVAFGEIITMQQIVGYAVLCAGVVWYNQVDMFVKTEERQKVAEMVSGSKTSQEA